MVELISRKQYHAKKGKKIFWKDDCPFCSQENNENHIVWKWKYWHILHNTAPYTGDENHLVACPNEHICFSEWLTKEHWSELPEVYWFMKEYFWDQDYFSATRETMGNRSVEHYHIHFIAGKLQWKYLRNMLMNQWFPIEEVL